MAAHVRQYLANPSFWGWFLSFVSLDRSASYWFRPPKVGNRVAVIETLIPYRGWAVILLVSGVLILIHALNMRRRVVGIAGHVLSIFCYGTFCASVVGDAFINGAPWAGSGTLLLTALIHVARLLLIAGGRRE